MRRTALLLLFTACGTDPQLPPTEKSAMEAWLAAQHYAGWACEPDAHPGRNGSPHGINRICSNARVSGNTAAQYSAGAASVKELLTGDGEVYGHSVMRKLTDGPIGADWYFFEESNGRVYANGADQSACVACHARAGSDGLPGKDFVFTQVD